MEKPYISTGQYFLTNFGGDVLFVFTQFLAQLPLSKITSRFEDLNLKSIEVAKVQPLPQCNKIQKSMHFTKSSEVSIFQLKDHLPQC